MIEVSRPFGGGESPGSYKWSYGHLVLACAATPFLLFPDQYPALTIFFLLMWPMWWAFLWLRNGQVLIPTPLDLPILALLTTIPLGAWLVPPDTLTLDTMSRVLLGILWYYGITQGVRRPLDLGWPLALVSGMGAAFCLLGVIATAWQVQKFPMFQPLYQLLPSVRLGGALAGSVNGESGFFHPNMIAGTLVVVVPLVLGSLPLWHQMAGAWGWVARFMGWGLTAAIVLVVGLTQSRMAWLTLSIVLLCFWGYRWWAPRWRWLGLGGIVSVMVALMSRELWVDALLGSRAAGSWRARVEVWTHAWWALQDFPLTGIGLGHFEPISRTFYPYRVVHESWHFGHAHNLWLQIGVEFGWLGVAAWALALLLSVWSVARVLAHCPPDHWLHRVALGLGNSLLAYTLFGLTDALPWGTKPGFVIWLVVGMSVVVGRLGTQIADPQAPRPSPENWRADPLWLVYAACMVVPLALWWFPLNAGLAALLAHQEPPPTLTASQGERLVLMAWQRQGALQREPHPLIYAQARLADWYLEYDMPQRALFWYNRAIVLQPSSALFVKQGDVFAALDQPEAAATAFSTALDIQPTQPAALYRLAELYIAQGDVAAARALLQPFLDRNTGDDEAYYLAEGYLAVANAEWETARQNFSKAAALRPQATTFFQQGRAALQAHHPHEAIATLERAWRLNPFDPWTAFFLGQAYQQTGNLSAAREAYQQAVTLAPDLAEAALALGQLLIQAGEPGPAISVLREALSQRPQHPDLLLWLARAAVQSGDVALATTTYAQLLRLDPQHQEASDYLRGGRDSS